MRSGYMRGAASVVRREAVALTAGTLCFAWALVGWLAVIPNQDILVDGIQAQSILLDPRIVLAFPGQKHGGPLEYPFTVLAEWLFPGNYYANGAVRPILAFVTGFLVAKLLNALFPGGPRWPFLAAVAVGPTILHGLLGPQGNPVGVWWLQPNWDLAWLLVTGGCLALARSLGNAGQADSRRRWLTALAAGLLVGAGLFAHPAIFLLAVPLVVLVLVRRPFRPRECGVALLGVAMGIVPAGISYVVNAEVNTWDPSHGAFIAVGYYISAGAAILGLNGIPDYMGALLPYGLGLPPSQDVIPGLVQSVLMWVFVVVVCASTVLGVWRAVRSRRALSAPAALAVAWLAAIAAMFAFITFITPVWIYSSGLGILLWISVGALPSCFGRKGLGTGLALGAIAVLAVSTLAHNRDYLVSLPHRVVVKADTLERLNSTATALEKAGAQVVYGSYYDAVPVGYASSWRLRTVTNTYNRFPLTLSERRSSQFVIAVDVAPTDEWGEQALERIEARCQPLGDAPVAGDFALFQCPTDVLLEQDQ